LLLFGILSVAVLGMTVGYALLGTNLLISGETKVVVGTPVRVAGVKPANPQPSCGYAPYSPTWDNTSFTVDGVLPALNCTVVFDISVRNDSNSMVLIEQIIENSFNNSANMEYEFSITPGSLDAVVRPQSKLDFKITFRYKGSVASLPQMTSFTANFQLVFEEVTQPILAATNGYRNFEIYRGNTAAPPSSLYSRLAAVDGLDGVITSSIVRTCTNSSNQVVTCPTAWADLPRGDYTITFNVTNSLGLSAAPISFYVNLWDFVKIAEGNLHVLALGSNGNVWSWGNGSSGALGLGDSNNRTSPVQITSLSDIIDIAAGNQTSFAVSSNGNLYAWGEAGSYRLGTGSATDRNTPYLISPPSGKKYVAVSAMEQNGGALTDTGEIYSWGDCYYSSCGSGNNTTTRQTPTLISGLSGIKIVAFSMGRANGAAVSDTGVLYNWGSNYYGQLGDGNTQLSTSHAISTWTGLTNVKAVCYGWYHAIVIKNDGTVWSWGSNTAVSSNTGRVGNGTANTNSYTPFQQTSISGARSCYADEFHSQVVTNSNVLYAWGRNTNYEIGHVNGTVAVNSPYLVAVGSIIAQSSIGNVSSHALITDNILVRGWGANGSGQIGNGTTTTPIPTWVGWNFTVPTLVQW
jgi:alpha-tubulin suppressor-like RCC1 family protein